MLATPAGMAVAAAVGAAGATAGVAAGEDIPLSDHRLDCNCWTFFCSFSFCVSANLTTIGDEQPSIVNEWCMALMAVIAVCRELNVTKAQPTRMENK